MSKSNSVHATKVPFHQAERTQVVAISAEESMVARVDDALEYITDVTENNTEHDR